ncbi:hypothetical protein ACIPSE_32725 [Streptomyces sp. NPDC090106]|uniref:hypothetical protein n=1 Tax=Streptomyces sp. NPDC090106 TaxID=3365946 RepID=UPI00380FE534
MTSNDWLDRLLNFPRDHKEGSKSPHQLITQLVTETDPPRPGRAELTRLVTERVRDSPELIELWQRYVEDLRRSPAPYMKGLVVGLWDRGERDVVEHDNEVDACADLAVREIEFLMRWNTD